MTVPCPRCETPFDTVNAAANHLWKSSNEAHSGAESLDAALREVVQAEADGESPDGEPETNGESDPGMTRTDGLGLDGPPEGETDEADAPDLEADEADETTAVEVPDDTVYCPTCGDDTGATYDELEHNHVYRCTNCRDRFKWKADAEAEA